MHATNKVLAEKLQHLTAILGDAAEGYALAAQHINDQVLAALFDKFSFQRRSFAREVKNLLSQMDMNPNAPEDFLSLLHSTWKNMQQNIRTGNKSEIISCCIMGENVTANYYAGIFDGSPIPEFVATVLQKQSAVIGKSIDEFNEEANSGRLAGYTRGREAVTEDGQKKISFLIAFLQQVSKDFEMIADDIEEPNLRNAMLAFSSEDKSFAEELCCQARHAGVSLSLSELSLYWDYLEASSAEEEMFERANEFAFICDKSESVFLKLYTDALKEFLSVNTLKEIMLYQYNSIRAAFMKLRMLNTIRFHTPLAPAV